VGNATGLLLVYTDVREARDKRPEPAAYASEGAVRQEGSLRVSECRYCAAEIVWATSRRTSKRYPVTVSRGYLDQRYYNKRNAHSCQAADPVGHYVAEYGPQH
jgi:hypothetical protein